MKKILLPLLLSSTLILTACTSTQAVNLLHFTDNLNRSYGYDKVKISDYFIKDNEYTLFIQEADTEFLLTLSENENGKIEKIRFTIGKTDNTGKTKAITDSEALLFYENALHILSAYSLFEEEECANILSRLLPDSGKAYSKTGELTSLWNNFSLAFYSNGLCCQLYVYNNYLNPPEETSKPVSRPAYGQTANIRED